MRAFNVTVARGRDGGAAQNMELPGGRVDEGARELTVRTMGRIAMPAEFNAIVIAAELTPSLSDIGYAEDGAEEPRTEARLNGQPAVTLVVSKQSGQNTVAVADAVKERLARTQEDPAAGFQDPRSSAISPSSSRLRSSDSPALIEGSILAAIVVFVFLWSFRSTLIAAHRDSDSRSSRRSA